jgi:hypothetical protein
MYLAFDKDLHYLTFMGRNIDNNKKLVLAWNDINIMKNVSFVYE